MEGKSCRQFPSGVTAIPFLTIFSSRWSDAEVDCFFCDDKKALVRLMIDEPEEDKQLDDGIRIQLV